MAALLPLEEKLQKFCIASRSCDHLFKHTLSQARQTERQIKNEFARIRQFLRDEEEARITAVREEQERKSRKMKEKIERMESDISTLSDTIKVVKGELVAEDISFLLAYKDTMKRVWGAPQIPEKDPGALIDVTGHLGNLKLRVWEKMQRTVQYTPVTLNPNTAASSLALSDDLTRVGHRGNEAGEGAGRQQLPNNPERFDPYACVLGSQAYASGRHAWEVEVGDSDNWTIGVAAGSVRRREEFSACPEEGLWTISLRDGGYWAMETPWCQIPVRSRPQRVRVELDWDAGRVTFSDSAEADGAPLYVFTGAFEGAFAGPVYPYFESVSGMRPLRLSPGRVCVRAVEDSAGWSPPPRPLPTSSDAPLPHKL